LQSFFLGYESSKQLKDTPKVLVFASIRWSQKLPIEENYFYFQALNEMTYEKIASTYFSPPML
jgi:hypothetical protein